MMAEAMPTEEKKHASAPPYNSLSTFTTFLNWLREMKVTPSHIDRSLWSTTFAGSVGTQLMTGLRFLHLLDGERPTDELEKLARAREEDRNPLLADLVRRVYGEAVVNEMESGTPKRLNDALSALGTTTATHDKARSFVINVAKLAGIPVQPSISKQARIRKTSGARRRSKSNGGAASDTVPTTKSKADSGEQSVDTVSLPSGATVTLTVDMNPLKVSPAERNWLFQLIDHFNTFSQDTAEPSEPALENKEPQDSD